MIKKYFYLLICLSSNLYSMENYYNINEKTALLQSKSKEIKFSNNINKNQKMLLELLPREIWLEILSYLDYKENRKMFIEFWGPNLGVSDLNAKNMAIDIYRSAILNSRDLDHWKKITKNACKTWKNKESREYVKNYLEVLNKDFKEEIEKYKPELLKNKNDFKKYWDEKLVQFKNNHRVLGDDPYTARFGTTYDKKVRAESKAFEYIVVFLELKRSLMIYKNIKPSFMNFNLEKFILMGSALERGESYCVVSVVAVVPGLLLMLGILLVALEYHQLKAVIIGGILIFIALLIPLISFVFWGLIYLNYYNEYRVNDIEYCLISLKDVLKSNKIDIFESNNYFLELLDHKFEQDHDILELEDVDLKTNGKDEDFSIV